MKNVRLGIIGLGNMGGLHAKSVHGGDIRGLILTAIADIDPKRLEAFSGVRRFSNHTELVRSGEVDAVLIATPHYSHTTIGIDALGAGLHVLVEKSISVHKADCERLIAAHRSKKQIFAAMFNQRTDPYYVKLRELVKSGELGEIRRINWIITSWFRTASYYSSGGWRATWAGEGGGVLLNQCPHNLDIWQWVFGPPHKVRAFCKIGRYHDIEVEDDVTAYLEYKNGTTGSFITSTGEAPGTNRLEVTAERGRVIIEDQKFLFTRNEMPMSEFSVKTTMPFSAPNTWKIEIPIREQVKQHKAVLENFTAAILDKHPLIAPASEGLHSVELANAMIYSSAIEKTVALPLDSKAYERWLKNKTKAPTFVKKSGKTIATPDFEKSFSR